MPVEIFEKVCTSCLGDPQPIENFHRKAKGRKGRAAICKACATAKTKAWSDANPGKASVRSVAWQKANPKRKNANTRRWKQKTGYDTSERGREVGRDSRRRARKEAIEAMGGKCSCCNCDVYAFLCFDHVGGWGSAHRLVVNQASMPAWLKKHHYPKGDGTICECGEVHQGVRLLCYNCNMSVAADPDGICAHQRTEPVDYSRFSERSRYERQWRLLVRDEVFTEYGGRCQCLGCDETNFAFLSVEHVGGWGKKHRAELKGTPMIQWLKRNGFPKDGIVLMCFNCNMSAGKSESGKCPHEVEIAKAA